MTATPLHSHLFATAIGDCGLVWGERGVRQVLLPDDDPSETARRMASSGASPWEGALPGVIAEAVRLITRYLSGQETDLGDIRLDMSGHGPFEVAAYEALRKVPWGRTVTYGELADSIGYPGGARAIGGAMGRNPFPPVVPCHRVLAAGGRIGGFSASGGTDTKLVLLDHEGTRIGGAERDQLNLFS